MNTFTGLNDAFGAAMKYYYENGDSALVIERDDGYLDNDYLKNYFSKYSEWRQIEKDSLRFAKGKILDVGSGAGRISLHLQEKGKNVTALDNSPLALQICRKRGVKKTIIADIKTFFPKSKYHTIIMFGNNFGLMQDRKTAISVLNKMYSYTDKDAIFMAESMDVGKTNNEYHLAYQKRNLSKNRMRGQIKFRLRFQKYATPYFDYLFVNKSELEEIVSKTKWKIFKIIKNESCNFIAILKKCL